jgi:hypothetical protein
MTVYKATVRNKQTNNYEVISGEYSSKKAFIEDLRRNGYAVNDKKVKKSDVYDAIIKYTDCDDDAWAICNTVEDAMDIFAAYERYFEKRERMYNEKYEEDTAEQPTVETVEEEKEMTTYTVIDEMRKGTDKEVFKGTVEDLRNYANNRIKEDIKELVIDEREIEYIQDCLIGNDFSIIIEEIGEYLFGDSGKYTVAGVDE